MYDLQHELLDALKSTPETLKGLLSRVTVAQARSAKGGDENWSVVEVICHLRDAEEISFQRMQAMRDQDHPKIAGYDQEALARERNYNEADLHAALNAFAGFRERHIAALCALSAEEWERSGEHNEFGQITIFAHTLHKVSHDAIHCAQIARQLLSSGNK
ncbi:MAG: DinB family protein [Chloroflexi bacterium]|nr:MAG: DinB family protein [Chloroflexota bacterium]